mmetsp:Transcript_45841/g.74795  ORF Transcript_45841/g.74795 Transcript_45841/m.74795 type:complete len:200 (+) Transcript_45841:918-1517(+)
MSFPSITAFTLGISIKTLEEALMKADIKPNLTLCFFWKSSLYFSRSSIKFVISISLKVVSMAAVFCASFSRSAIRLLIRDIGTRFSRLESTGRTAAAAAEASEEASGDLAIVKGAACVFSWGTGMARGASATTSASEAAGLLTGAAAVSEGGPLLMVASGVPTTTVAPDSARVDVMTPLSGALTSTVTLSVSIWTMVSS